MKKWTIRWILLLLAVCFLGVGCTLKNADNIEKNQVKISPSKLFEGDAKKLEPHMNLISGAVHITYNGEKQYINCQYEVWEKGKKITNDNLFSSLIEEGFDGDLTISLRECMNDQFEISDRLMVTTAIGDDYGYSSNKMFIDRFDRSYSYAPQPLFEEMITSDDVVTDVWGLIANDEGCFSPERDLQESAEKADWAFVMRVYLTD